MEEINVRFREIRESLGKSQEDMGKTIGLTKSGISNIERGNRKVTEKHIKLLCVEPIDGKYINEEYIRSGKGDMFLELPEDDEVALYVSELLEDSDNPFCEIIIEIMHTYSELSPRSKEALKEAAAKFRDNLRKKREG